MRETGQVLKHVRVADCADGPHEVHGCVRNDLVKTLADALPQGTLRLGCSVASVDIATEGALLHAQCYCHLRRPHLIYILRTSI